jgi:hypothetical protein
MASPPRVYSIAFTVPAGTPQSAPISKTWRTEDNTIEDIELEIPPGHNGLTGIRVMKGDVQILPWSQGTFIVANDYVRTFPIGVYVPTSDVTLQAYNTGSFPHTFYLRMTVTTYDQPSAQQSSASTQALPAEPVTSAPDPLSPDALIGPDTASALSDGTITPADVAPVDASNLTIPPEPQPSITG